MKEEKESIIQLVSLVILGIGLGMSIGNIYFHNSWDNGVLEGRCLERGGTLHNVDGSLKCVINNNLE